MRSLLISVRGQGWGVQLVYAGHLLLAWGVIFDMRKIEVLSVFSRFWTGVEVYVGLCVCTRKNTLAARWILGCGSGTLREPEESRRI